MRRFIAQLLVATLLGSTSAPAQQPVTGSWREQLKRIATRSRPAHRRTSVHPLATPVAESEPNNQVATADSVALGDQASGLIHPAADVDVWSVDLTAGQFVSIDVDAGAIGSPLDPTLLLIAPDGVTQVAFNDDFDDFDSRISYHVPASGRYFVAIRAFGLAGGPTLTYRINLGLITCGPAGTEHEPNGTAATANPLAIGGDAGGEICSADNNPAGDVDFWAFTAAAGTSIELDVDALSLGLLADPFLALYAGDGITLLASNDNADALDSRLQFSFATGGTFYAAVSTIMDPGGNPFPYVLHLRAIRGGPGDPITVTAPNLGRPLGIAAGKNGELFVSDLEGNRVLRVSAQGTVTTFAPDILRPQALAFDASGNLLVASLDGTVYRVTPQGQASPFITDAGAPFWIAMGRDGRIWLTTLTDRALHRYSPTGRAETTFDALRLGGFGPGPLAIGPDGLPYFSIGTEVWRLANGQFQRVIADPFVLWGFAFDADGNIYAPAPAAGLIKLFDRTGRGLADPFAVSPDTPQALAFGRDQTGAPVARVFATEPLAGRVIELNPTGVARPGLPLGFVPPEFSLDAAVSTLLGGGGLSPADAQLLDALGNHNGRYDVGDLQAYLQTVGSTP